MLNIATLLSLSVLVLSQNQPYRKVVNDLDPQAKCLDGSSPAMYVSEGDPKRILLYFEGGASCAGADLAQTIEACYQRSMIHLGSSTYWPETNKFSGMLSNDFDSNVFASWTKVVMLYCDGAFHQGNSQSPIKYKNSSLYFRGSVNTRSHFKWVSSKYDLTQAEKVVLSGSSAGGIASFIWADYLKAMIGKDTEYFVVPDSGIFLNPADPLLPSTARLL